ncbi:uncharacterized protein LOC132205327 [Neocloeon triangulifer]|uniref:uncharacterized protein LOC132205327 n=1 Tax=Neocloeon triangulifer TaxID=2078957 RepID=UPI00286F88CF|nr:uncharacterized protein LOC132205327 [Neocloeon triangulifer]
MKLRPIWCWAVALGLFVGTVRAERPAEKTLSRKKRYLTFPEGSGLSLVYCLTWGAYITDLFTWGATVGLGFPLPTDTKFFLSKFDSDQLHRRDRRQVFTKIKILLDEHGRNGRSCVLKALCEADSELPQGSFLDALFRAVFSFPRSKKEDLEDWDHAHKKSHRNVTSCSEAYPECDISFFNRDFGT